MAERFKGQVALVTGGNSGIGRAAAVAFAVEGASVVVAARRKSESEETVQLIRDAGGEAIAVRTDVPVDENARVNLELWALCETREAEEVVALEANGRHG